MSNWCLRGCRFSRIMSSHASATLPSGAKLSKYAEKLPEAAKSRYLPKIELVGGVDPLLLERPPVEMTMFPPVDSSDIVSYLFLQTSFITAKQFKAHKSLEAYNQFVNGWVKDVRAHDVGDKSVVVGRVSTSNFQIDSCS